MKARLSAVLGIKVNERPVSHVASRATSFVPLFVFSGEEHRGKITVTSLTVCKKISSVCWGSVNSVKVVFPNVLNPTARNKSVFIRSF